MTSTVLQRKFALVNPGGEFNRKSTDGGGRMTLLAGFILSAGLLAAGMPALAAEKVLDESPCYWYTFDGKPESHGLEELGFTETPDGVHDFSRVSGYEEVRPGVRGARMGTDIHGGYFYKGNGSFTLFISAKGGPNNAMGENVYAPLMTLGQNGTIGKSLSFVQVNSVVMGIAQLEGTSSKAVLNAVVPACCNSVHPYAVVYDAERSKVQLYADGVYVNEVDFTFSGEAVPFQFGSVYGGFPSGEMKRANSTGVIEEFRTYNRVLSAAEVKALSDAYPVYSGGVTGAAPYHWWEFKNGVINTMKSYPTALGFGYGTQVSGPRGETASNGFTGNCWGSGFDYGSGKPFTIALYARLNCDILDGCGGVLFALGSKSSSGNISISGNTVGGIWGTSWNNGSLRSVFLGKNPLDRPTDFHSIVVTCDQSVWKLYVDGEQSGADVSVNTVPMPNDGNWQFGAVNGGNFWVLGNGKYSISDFRFYHVALTPAQVAELAAAQPVWPGADQVWKGGDVWTGTETNWMTWNASTWSETLAAFNPALSAVIDVPVKMELPTNFQVGDLTLNSKVEIPATTGGFVCESLVVGDKGSLTVSGVTKRIVPGACIARSPNGGAFSGIDLDTHDEWDNAFYQNMRCTRLFFGKPGGVTVIVR